MYIDTHIYIYLLVVDKEGKKVNRLLLTEVNNTTYASHCTLAPSVTHPHRLIHSHWPPHWPPHWPLHWHANEAIDLLSDIFTSLHVAVLKSLKRFFYCQWELEESLHRHLVKAKLKSCSVQTITLTANHGETPKSSLIGSCICSRVQAQTFRLLSGGGDS